MNNFQHLENVIKSRIPSLQSLISKTIAELESELSRLGKPVATDAGVGSALMFVCVCVCVFSLINMIFFVTT